MKSELREYLCDVLISVHRDYSAALRWNNKHPVTTLAEKVRPDVIRRHHAAVTLEEANPFADTAEEVIPRRENWQAVFMTANAARTRQRIALVVPSAESKSLPMLQTLVYLAEEASKKLDGARDLPDDLPVPIFATLSDIMREFPAANRNNPAQALREALSVVFQRDYSGSRDRSQVPEYLMKCLDFKGTWLVLDAIDEGENLDALLCLLDALDELPCNAMITSWKLQFQMIRERYGFDEFAIPALTPEQIQRFTDCYHVRAPFDGSSVDFVEHDPSCGGRSVDFFEHDPSCEVLAGDPFVLALICALKSRFGKPLKVTRSDVYQQTFQVLHRASDPYVKSISELMLKCFLENPRVVSLSADRIEKELTTSWRRAHPDADTGSIRQFLDKLCTDRFLIRSSDHSYYRTAQRAFQEFLVAKALVDHCEGRADFCLDANLNPPPANRPDELTRFLGVKAWAPEWESVVAFAVGLCEHPKAILEVLCDEKSDDILRHRLVVAIRCLAEIPRASFPDYQRWADKMATTFVGCAVGSKDREVYRVQQHMKDVIPLLAVSQGRVEGQPFVDYLARQMQATDPVARARAAAISVHLGAAARRGRVAKSPRC